MKTRSKTEPPRVEDLEPIRYDAIEVRNISGKGPGVVAVKRIEKYKAVAIYNGELLTTS